MLIGGVKCPPDATLRGGESIPQMDVYSRFQAPRGICGDLGGGELPKM